MTVKKPDQGTHTHLPPARLVESPSNPRQSYDPVALEELTASLKTQGVIEPLIVRLAPGKPGKGKTPKYEIVCGSRRYRAAKAAKLDSVPCIVRQLTDVEVLQLQVVENQQRADVHPIEEAAGYAALKDKHGMKVDDIAAQIAMSREHVYTRLKLANLAGDCRQAFLDNRLTAGHAVQLARLSPALQDEVYGRGLFLKPPGGDPVACSVRDLGKLIDRVRLKLKGAKWKLDQPVGDLPLCIDCPYNSTNDPGNPEDGMCLDPGCYEAKLDKVIEDARTEAEAAGSPLLPITEDRFFHMPGVKTAQDYKPCKATAKGATKAIHVAGAQKGKTTYVTLSKQSKVEKGEAKPKWQLEQEAAEAERKACNKGRRAAFAEISATMWNAMLDGDFTEKQQHALVDFCATAAFTKLFHQAHYDQTAKRHELVTPDKDGKLTLKPGEGEGLVLKHLRALNPLQKIAFIAEALAQHDVNLSQYANGAADRLTELGKVMGVEVKAFEQDAVAEAQERRDLRAAKAQAKLDKELAEVKAVRAERAAEAKAQAKAKAAKGNGKGKAKAKPAKPAKAGKSKSGAKPKPTKAKAPKAKAAAKATKPKAKKK